MIIIPKSNAALGLLAYVVTAKYQDAWPLGSASVILMDETTV
jgi:transposase